MFDLIILCISLLIVGILIRIKINIGLSIFFTALAVLLLEKISILEFPKIFLSSIKSKDSIRMVLIVISVTYFAELLKKSGYLNDIVKSFKSIFPPKFTIPFFSLIIGVLPMPGGALVSAPLVEEGSKETELKDSEKTAINFWFRHVWEAISPLYPELSLSASILGVSILKIISIQWPVSLGMLVSGILFFIRKIKGDNGSENRKFSFLNITRAIVSIFPIIFIVIFMLVFKNIPTYFAILVGILYIIIRKRLKLNVILKAFNTKNIINFSFLMISIFFLREVSLKSGMAERIYEFFIESKFPIPIILFFLPFSLGFLTGISSAAIGITYSLMLPILKAGNQLVGVNLFIAYIGLWFSLLITPAHLCLSLSSEYFKTKITETYRVMAKGIILLAIISIAWIIILYAL